MRSQHVASQHPILNRKWKASAWHVKNQFLTENSQWKVRTWHLHVYLSNQMRSIQPIWISARGMVNTNYKPIRDITQPHNALFKQSIINQHVASQKPILKRQKPSNATLQQPMRGQHVASQHQIKTSTWHLNAQFSTANEKPARDILRLPFSNSQREASTWFLRLLTRSSNSQRQPSTLLLNTEFSTVKEKPARNSRIRISNSKRGAGTWLQSPQFSTVNETPARGTWRTRLQQPMPRVNRPGDMPH